MRPVWRIFNALMGTLLVFSAALQYNDPNPLRWAAVYLAAALPCWLALNGHSFRLWPAVVGGVSLAWAVTYLLRGVPTVSPLHMFDEWEMKNQQVLETRELFGLLIVTAWMLVLVIAAWRAGRRKLDAPG
jgi:Transmembrane family 220, helix